MAASSQKIMLHLAKSGFGREVPILDRPVMSFMPLRGPPRWLLKLVLNSPSASSRRLLGKGHRPMNNSAAITYPLLQEILSIRNLSLQATYTIHDLAELFHVGARAIENRVASGQIVARDLPGRARFLPQDIEAFLVASKKGGSRRGK
jgi:hypothetical protein